MTQTLDVNATYLSKLSRFYGDRGASPIPEAVLDKARRVLVDFLSEVEPGDLAFFQNEEGDIIHVGVLANSHQIIHASGYVKKEIIDAQGIISSQTGKYSHQLRVIKRIL